MTYHPFHQTLQALPGLFDVAPRRSATDRGGERSAFEQAAELLCRGIRHAPLVGVEFVGSLTPEFVNSVLDGWLSFSRGTRNFLLDYDFSLVAARTAREAVSEAFTQIWKNDPFQRTHIDHVGGAYLGNSKTALLTEFILNASIEPSAFNGLSPQTLVNGTWDLQPLDEIACTVRHEVWHALSALCGEAIRTTEVHTWPGFEKAYIADLKNLGGAQKALDLGYLYFVPDQNMSFKRACDETLAELGAEVSGGSLMGKRMAQDWPRCTAYVKSLSQDLAAVTTRRQRGAEAFLFERYEEEQIGAGTFLFDIERVRARPQGVRTLNRSPSVSFH